MRTNTNEEAIVSHLRDEIMDDLRTETVGIQIRVAFALLVAVILDGSHHEPEAVRHSLLELQDMMRVVQ